MPGVSGFVIIVTGCSSGLGLETASQLLQQGAKVFGVDMKAAPETLKQHPRFRFQVHDLTSPAAPLVIPKACAAEFGPRIDALLNVAGVMDHMSSVDTLDDRVWDTVIAVDLTAPVRLMREVVNVMKGQEVRDGVRGSIVNVSSRAGMSGAAAGVAYTAAKHGLVGATKQVAFRFRAEKIRCNAVCPGGVATGMPIDVDKLDRAAVAACQAARLAAQPDAAMLEPRTVAEVLVWLAGEGAKGLTGAIVPVDEGWSTV